MKLTERQILSPALRTVLYWAICVASIYCGEQLHICNQLGAKGLDNWHIYFSEAMLFASPALFLKGRARIASAIIASIFLLWLWGADIAGRLHGKSDATADSLKIQAWHISELIIRSGLIPEF